MSKYYLKIANQIEGEIYDLVRETKMYVFLFQTNGVHTYRVHKTSLNIKGIKYGKNPYRFDVPKASILKRLSPNS